jgi:hypothetical protein
LGSKISPTQNVVETMLVCHGYGSTGGAATGGAVAVAVGVGVGVSDAVDVDVEVEEDPEEGSDEWL